MTQGQLDAVVAELRRQHYSLRWPLTYNGLRQVLRDERIKVRSAPCPTTRCA